MASWGLLSKKVFGAALCVLLVGPVAHAATIFAVASGGTALDGGTLSVAAGSTTTIDIYLDAGAAENIGFTVDLYSTANGSVLSNIVVNPSDVLGNTQSYGYRGNNQCVACSPLLLFATVDVTVGGVGTSLTGDGFILDGITFTQPVVALTTLVQVVPEPGTALLLALGLSGIAVLGRKCSA